MGGITISNHPPLNILQAGARPDTVQRMYHSLRPWLFRLDAERVHEWALKIMPLLSGLLGQKYRLNDARLQTCVAGKIFDNPVGLAAGFDKSATVIDALESFGFGFVEVGTLTPRPQAGNVRPRLFRIPEQKALLNRMGFNNDGADLAAHRLERRRTKLPVGVNIGKNRDTPLPEAMNDYVAVLKRIADRADYLVINVSSPNTPGLRLLQDKAAMDEILAALTEANSAKVPLFLKVAPDIEEKGLDDILEVGTRRQLAGYIATNTTVDKSALPPRWKDEAGGVSGLPVAAASDRVLEYLARHKPEVCALIGVGGVMGVEDLIRKFELGADLVQVYTGWVYGGPGFVHQLLKGLLEHLDRHDLSLKELIGSGLR